MPLTGRGGSNPPSDTHYLQKHEGPGEPGPFEGPCAYCVPIQPRIPSEIVTTARSSRSRRTCWYTFWVTAGELWPRSSDTYRTSTPASKRGMGRRAHFRIGGHARVERATPTNEMFQMAAELYDAQPPRRKGELLAQRTRGVKGLSPRKWRLCMTCSKIRKCVGA